MSGAPPIYNFKEVTEKCKGCTFVYELRVMGTKRLICSRCLEPQINFFFSEKCKDYYPRKPATFLKSVLKSIRELF